MFILTEIKNIDKPVWLRVEDTDTHWNIFGLKPVTIIFGKNGSGKSNLLKNIAQKRGETIVIEAVLGVSERQEVKVSYKKTSPERGGIYKTDGNIITNLSNDPNFTANANIENESRQFRHVVAFTDETKILLLLTIP